MMKKIIISGLIVLVIGVLSWIYLESKELSIIRLEDQNFKIDGGLSVEQKIAKGWKLKKYMSTTKKIYIEGIENASGDVFEYISGVDEKNIGEQIFTRDSASREITKEGKMLPIYKNISGTYAMFSGGENSVKSVGFFEYKDRGIHEEGTTSTFLFSGNLVSVSIDYFTYPPKIFGIYLSPKGYDERNMFSVRCVKDKLSLRDSLKRFFSELINK